MDMPWTCHFIRILKSEPVAFAYTCLQTDDNNKEKKQPQRHGLLGESNKFYLAKLCVSISKSKTLQGSAKKHPGRENMGKVFQRIDNMAHNTDPFGCAYPSVLMSGRMEGRRGRER